jgi:hypothetical protein
MLLDQKLNRRRNSDSVKARADPGVIFAYCHGLYQTAH